MPLIDSVVEVTVKKRQNNHLIISEKDGTLYRFDPGNGEYIENETLSIRVTGLERNLEIGQNDALFGVVVDSELRLSESFHFPVEVIETGVWDPGWKYGKTAAKDFFPDHCERKWRMLSFSFSTPIDEEDVTFINSASDKLSEGLHDEAAGMISDTLSKIPWLVDLYHVMGVISQSHRRMLSAEKYFSMGIKISESILPDTDDFIMDYREPANGFYLSHIHSLADLLLQIGRKDEAIDLYRKCYHLMPQDPGGVRVKLQALTGRTYPQTDENTREYPVDPYLQPGRYSDLPIRDGYDPNVRINYDEWLGWEQSYRRLLIFHAHNYWFMANKMSDKDRLIHLMIHELAETAIARNDPSGIRVSLARYIANGTSRHDALHIIGEALLKEFAENYMTD